MPNGVGEQAHAAVIRGARYGQWNGQSPGLFFESWIPDGYATLHVLHDRESRAVMTQAGVSAAELATLLGQTGVGGANVRQLEGHPCLIGIDGYCVRFLRLTGASQQSPTP